MKIHSQMAAQEEILSVWDRLAPWYSELDRKGFPPHEYILKPAMLTLLGDLRGLDILEIGCGAGYFTGLLASAGARVVGIDISERMLELARASLKEQRVDVDLLRANICSLSSHGIREDSFDVAVANMVFMDVVDYGGAIAEIARVLRRCGRLVFSVNHPCFGRRGSKWVDQLRDSRTGTEHDYFKRKRAEVVLIGEDGRMNSIPIVNIHRTLEEYVDSLRRHRFVISALAEPEPTAEGLRAYPGCWHAELESPPYLIVDSRHRG